MYTRYLFTSVTRIAPFSQMPFSVEALPRPDWEAGDYVACEVSETLAGYKRIELTNGRMMEIARGDLIVGALGIRHATLEATGTWEQTAEDGGMHMLTSAGLLGRLTSISPLQPPYPVLRYKGHLRLAGEKATMRRFVRAAPERPFTAPVVLLVGSSMSSGKTTAAKVIVRQLKKGGSKVLGAKLTGAARYRDILSMADAGADHVFDFVDVGLPSTVHPEAAYRTALRMLLSRMAQVEVDAAIVEIGSSPLEPYNGAAAIEEIRSNIQCTILCAFDPYAVYGVTEAFGIRPDLVSGVATSTLAGIELIEKLCGVRALNLLDPDAAPVLNGIVRNALGLSPGNGEG